MPPSQATVAANVARDVVDDLIPAPCRPVIGGLVAVIAALVLYILLSRSRPDA